MNWAIRSYRLLLALAVSLAVCGCSGDQRTPPSKTGTDDATPSKTNPITGELTVSETNTKPEALSRENYLRLDQQIAEAELGKIFGPPQELGQESKDTRKYTWLSGKTKLVVHVKDGKVVASWYPGEHEERTKRSASLQAANAIMDSLRDYVLKNKNRFPGRLEDLDLADLIKRHPEVGEPLKRGDVVLPWGKSANRLVWAWWKDTPQHGGPYLRFDGKQFQQCTPQEFARVEAVVLTADTVPADIIEGSKPGPGEGRTLADREKKGIGAQGFFTANELLHLLAGNPASLDDLAKHRVRNYWHAEILRALEKGEIIVRWGRDPRMGVYAYPRGFPQMKEAWAIYKGQWAPFERPDEAKKAFDE